ncbi:MAG: DNA polymerase IV [Nitrospira sp.]|jgi:DNA polymerase-4|nr:MAG: DNA polymerase IV [Nitrospira sp.]
MDRQIACFGIPAFEVAVARLHDPSLSTRPLAIAPLITSRACLREVSSEAEQAGLAIGMSVEQARRVCPSLHILSPNPSRIRTAEASLLHIVSRYAPVWEPVQSGSFVMDLTGTGRLFGPPHDVAAKVQHEVLTQYRLDGVAGVGSNKLVAQTAATLIQPSELYDVRPGSEPVFMAPLSVRTLLGLQRPCMRHVLSRLDDLNLDTLGDVAESPVDALEVALGDYAGQLSRWAQGIDSLPVLPPASQPHLEEMVLLDPDEIDDPVLTSRLLDALQRLCRTLRSQRRVCGRLSLTIRYSDHLEVSKHERVTLETCWEYDLSPMVLSLFQKCMRRSIRLRTMTLSMAGLTGLTEQGVLFDARPVEEQRRLERAKKLAVALDQLHARFGEQVIRYGRNR